MNKRGLEHYIAFNFEDLVGRQEETLGIKYTAIPRVIVVESSSFPPDIIGTYSEGIIRIPARKDLKETSIEATLYALLGQHYINETIQNNERLKRIEELFKEDYLKGVEKGYGLRNPKKRAMQVGVALSLVKAGISQYFSIKMTGKEPNAPAYQPKTREELFDLLSGNYQSPEQHRELFHITGYRLVEPILNEDVKEGTLHLLKKPPWNYLDNLRKYQQKAIEEVKRQKAKKNQS